MVAAGTSLALELRHLSKVFQVQRALDDVDLELQVGEVHALLGPNGSGKSTLIKILAGFHEAEAGAEASLFGEPFGLGSHTRAHPIRFIHQDLGLVGPLDAVDNLALGGQYARRWWLSDRVERRAAGAKLAAFGVAMDVSAPVESLSRAVQTMLALVRAVDTGLGAQGLLVLDEPTASLPAREVGVLFDLVHEYKRKGGTVLYVTHRLAEVFEVADRVSVLRDGRRVATVPVGELDHDRLVELIVGRQLEEVTAGGDTAPDGGEKRLSVRGLAGAGIEAFDLDARAREVVGVSGLVGSGYEDVLRLVFTGDERTAGEVAVDGRPLPVRGPRASIEAGLAYAPADRKRLSAITAWTSRENVTLPALRPHGVLRWLSDRRETRDAKEWMDRLNVVPDDPNRVFTQLSGGNQQKVVIARWLRCGARVFLLEEPTNGVDVGAKRAIYQALRDVAATGAAVVMTSQDAEELAGFCDRVIVLREGRIGAVLSGPDQTPERIVAESVRRTPDTDVKEGSSDNQ
jgi:ribose transport system ATP-binding protein